MKKISHFILANLLYIFSTGLYAQTDSLNIHYFGLTPPENTPLLFNPEFIPDSAFVQNSCFSPDGKEFYYVLTDGNWSFSKMFYIKNRQGKWSEPEQLFSELPLCLTPFVSYDNTKLVFISSQNSETVSGDVFIASRDGNTWTKPEVLNTPVNSEYDEWEVSLSRNGTMYFTSNRPGGYGEMDIYKSEYVNGNYTKIENLGSTINTYSLDECAFIAPDESYMIFNSWKKSDHKGNNLYISFNRNGQWTNPKSLGDNVNNDFLNIYPNVSPDEKYIFFTIRKKPMNCEEPSKLYWVSSSIIESIRNTDFIPYVKKEISDTSFEMGTELSFKIPTGTFIDDDTNDELKYSAALESGERLPDWIEFIPDSLQFYGIPVKEEILNIKITVSDNTSAEAHTMFKLKIIKSD